jgi:hypothetical protein
MGLVGFYRAVVRCASLRQRLRRVNIVADVLPKMECFAATGYARGRTSDDFKNYLRSMYAEKKKIYEPGVMEENGKISAMG